MSKRHKKRRKHTELWNQAEKEVNWAFKKPRHSEAVGNTVQTFHHTDITYLTLKTKYQSGSWQEDVCGCVRNFCQIIQMCNYIFPCPLQLWWQLLETSHLRLNEEAVGHRHSHRPSWLYCSTIGGLKVWSLSMFEQERKHCIIYSTWSQWFVLFNLQLS